MKKILLFGMENITPKVLKLLFGNEKGVLENYGFIGFVDNVRKQKNFMGLPVFLPAEVKNMEFDKIVITDRDKIQDPVDYNIIHDELAYGYGFGADRVTDIKYLINIKLIDDLHNGKIQDAEMEQTVRQIETLNDFDLWCGYCPKPEEKYEVTWDEDSSMPYAMFEGKKIFFPRNIILKEIDGKQYVEGLEFEQQSGSPHTYITDEICIKEGDVVVDAGVQQGNFALKYIDKVSKLYLIESDPRWIAALRMTFKDYMNKVEIVPKFLGNVNDGKTVTLDKLVGNERVDFIKMDIEGAEIDALKGSKNVFLNNDIRCSICSYHKHGDEKNIKEILGSYGYATTTSNGHMFFEFDRDLFMRYEPRHGIVYGKKGSFSESK